MWLQCIFDGIEEKIKAHCKNILAPNEFELAANFGPGDVELFDYETMNADLAHFAPNCATFSRAREIPIPGVKNPPKPLRSSEHPRGIPKEVSRLSKRARLRMEAYVLASVLDDHGQRFGPEAYVTVEQEEITGDRGRPTNMASLWRHAGGSKTRVI